jgi:hypothetical protein
MIPLSLETTSILYLNKQIAREALSYFRDVYRPQSLLGLGSVAFSTPEHLKDYFPSSSKINRRHLVARLYFYPENKDVSADKVNHIIKTIAEADGVSDMAKWRNQREESLYRDTFDPSKEYSF